MTEKNLRLNGTTVAYRIYGEGRPVMLVHGFGETGNVWHTQATFLSRKFRIIVPDLPGSGGSELQTDMTMEGLAETLKALSGHECTEPFTMIGHSMGGYVMLAFAEKYPELLRTFGLFHSSAFADGEEKIATRRKGIAFIREHGAFAFLKNTSPNLFSPRSKEQKPALIDGFIAGLSNFSAPALVSYYESMILRPDRRSVLINAVGPVLFVMGAFDNAIPLEDGLRLCQLPEKVYIDILSQSGHMGMLEEGEKANEILDKFLTEA